MSINIFQPEVMDAVLRVTPPQAAFFRDTFFKTRKLEPNTKVRCDFYKGTRRTAPFVSEKAPARVTEKIGYYTEEYETPLVRVKDVTDIEDLMKRLPGELVQSGYSPDTRAVELLTNVMQDFESQIARREEVMCAQAMLTGKIPVVGENVNYEVDFGFTNKSTLSQLWDASNATADPLADLKAMAVQCMKKGYRKPNLCIMERSAFDAFSKRCIALGSLDQKHFLDLSLEPSARGENLTYCGRLRDPDLEIYIYDEWYLDDWSGAAREEKPVMPKGYILLASSNAAFSMYYGVMVFAEENTRTFRSVIGTRAADSWVQKEPAQRFITLSSRPLPVPHEVDSWYVAQVSATV